jgi:hypothetical protein
MAQNISDVLHRSTLAQQSARDAMAENIRIVAFPAASMKCRDDGLCGRTRLDRVVMGCAISERRSPDSLSSAART